MSKGECIIMGDLPIGHIQCLESTGGEDQQFLFLIQDSFLTQHMLEPTSGENVLDIVLPSQNNWVTLIIIKYILTSKKNQKVKKHTGETSTKVNMKI